MSQQYYMPFVKKPFFLLYPSSTPPVCNPPTQAVSGKPPVSYASLWNQERLKISGLGSPSSPVIQQNNAF